jgi:hypothetical protein
LCFAIQKKVFGEHIGAKVLCPGRVVVLDMPLYQNAPAVILQGAAKDKYLKVLVLCDANPKEDGSSQSEDWTILPRPVRDQTLYIPEGQCSQAVITIGVEDIAVVTSKMLKIAAEKILEDAKKRELPRFKYGAVNGSLRVFFFFIVVLLQLRVRLFHGIQVHHVSSGCCVTFALV